MCPVHQCVWPVIAADAAADADDATVVSETIAAFAASVITAVGTAVDTTAVAAADSSNS